MSSYKGIIAILSNFIALILAGIAFILTFVMFELEDFTTQLQLLLSTSSLLLLTLLSSIVATYNYKELLSQNKNLQNNKFLNFLISILPIGEFIVLLVWLFIAVRLLMGM